MIRISLWGSRANFVMHLFVFLCCLAIASSGWAKDTVNHLVAYPVTEGMPRSADFTVKVRTPGQRWQDLPAYLVNAAEGGRRVRRGGKAVSWGGGLLGGGPLTENNTKAVPTRGGEFVYQQRGTPPNPVPPPQPRPPGTAPPVGGRGGSRRDAVLIEF